MDMSKSRQIFMAVSIGAAYIGWGLLLSLQPPFYPTEAEKKGATPSQYGFVFGIANLAAFIFAPIFGRYGAQIGPKILYNAGAFTQGIVGISFGFLEYVQDTGAFIGLSYLLRFLDGMADAASWGAVVSILMKLYPNKVSTIMSWTEMVFGLGYMLGPALGSALYSAGGFLLPFIVVGSWCLVVAIALYFAIPNVKPDNSDRADTGKSLTLLGLLKSPTIIMPFIDNFICFSGNGMIESMLEPHLKNAAGATQMEVGLTFLILGGVYMVSTPVAGYICDKINYPTLVSILGNLFMAIAFLFIGPVPFIPLSPSVSLIEGMMAVVGFGYAMVMVSTFGRAQSAAIRKGFKDDIDTYLLISGMWSTSFYFGNFLGPTIAGFVVESVGFRATTIGFFVIYVAILVVDFFELFYNIRVRRKAAEYQQLD